MEHLYTPWRMTYIKGEKQPVEGCVFCNKIDGEDDGEYVIARSKHVYITLNKYPYTNGHLMVVPYDHITSQEDMCVEALTDMMIVVNKTLSILRQAYQPHGFNIGANLGAVAGAGIAAHYHFHVVPRWPGDANFMTTVGNTRVIPDSLDSTYKQLKSLWQKHYKD